MNTLRFISERFALKATLPMVAILCLGPLSLVPFTMADGFIGFMTLFVSLLCLRMVDDLVSIEKDRITHPNRGLPSGRISASKLKWTAMTLITLVVLGNGVRGHVGSPLIPVCFYGLFFFLNKRIPLMIKPFLSNAVFCWIPLYIAYHTLHRFSGAHLLLGLFAYSSAVAHEYAHSVLSQDEAAALGRSYSSLIGARPSAVLSCLIYMAAGAMGVAFWYHSGRPISFILVLGMTAAQMVCLEIRLIRQPSSQNAHPFYVNGFAFFLLPYAALILDRLLPHLLFLIRSGK